jgi:hypothetical protein
MRAKAQPQVKFQADDFVLYRDPARFWAGEAGHTFVCRIIWSFDAIVLWDIRGRQRFEDVDPRYMRLLPAVDCMRDIDTAPLASDDPGLHPAAVAWLEQNTMRAEVQPGGAS